MNAHPRTQSAGLRRLCGLALSSLLLAVVGCTSLPPKTADVSPDQAGTVNVSGASGQVSATAERKALQTLVNEGKRDLTIHHLKTLTATGDADLYQGNRTRLLIDGPATFGAMKAAIAQARGRVLLQSYIVEDEGVAAEVAELLAADGLPATLDERRPFDHGVWVPLSLMYPRADIPVVQVSLPSQAGPELQTRIGHALSSLRKQGVLLIGSGSITHNLRELDWHAGPESVEPWALAFRDWMIDKLAANDEPALHDYRQQAPHAVRSHPSDEHLLPLFTALGAAGDGAQPQAFFRGISDHVIAMDGYTFH